MTERRVVSFRVGKAHPDFRTAYTHCFEARRLRNTIVAVSRESNSYKMFSDDSKHQANTSIADSVGPKCAEFVRNSPWLGYTHTFNELLSEIAEAQKVILPAKVSQRVGIGVAQSWKSFHNNQSKDGRAPRYTKMFHTVEYTKQAISSRKLRNGLVVPTGWRHGFRLPPHIRADQVNAARLVPQSAHEFRLEVVYTYTLSTPVEGGELIAGVDLGVNNLAAVAFSDHREGILVNGRPLKSVNAFYNKLIAKHRSVVDVETENKSRKLNGDTKRGEEGYTWVNLRPSVKTDTLWNRRNRKINHYLHTVTSQLTAELVTAGAGTVVIGWSEHFKKRLTLGKRNNQSFALIPHRKFVDELTRKLSEHGVRVVEREESYTSKASFIDGDPIPVYTREKQGTYSFSGRRTKRGLYVTASGARINADLNGGYNIAAKEFNEISPPNGVWDKGTVVVPVRRLETRGFQHRRTEPVSV